MTEAHFAATRRPARPWSLGSLFGLLLVVIIGLSPAVAATGTVGRHRSDREGAAAARALPMAGPASVTLGVSRLFTTQFDGSRYANGNCNMAAGAMLFEVQTGRTVTGATMRRWSGARTQGTTLGDLRRAFRRQGQRLETWEDMPWKLFRREVRRGRSAVVQGWYGNLPGKHVLQAGFTTAHSVFVLGYSRFARGRHGGFYVMDPLGSGSYDGAWWSRRALRRFGWSGKPHTIGTGKKAYYGNVALQSGSSPKHLSTRSYRPTFQSYWATSKALIERSHEVKLVPARRGVTFVLKVRDPRLKLTAAKARLKELSLPVAAWKRVVSEYGTRHRKLVVQTKPKAKAVAAAGGRVVYRGWTFRHGKTLWIQHGPRLFTVYQGLASVRVEPGQWVRAGKVLGVVIARTSKPVRGKNKKHVARSGQLQFSVAVGSDPRSSSTRRFPLPFLGGGHGTLR